ncbi:MAG TPA: CoA transferase [Candidatus Dormibacteraeota bacterium]|jgi:formyl-CoA transferase
MASPAPLTGVRVIEVGNYMAAPFCCMQLADLGAEVIKVEVPTTGDLVRTAAPFLSGESSTFIRLNRNKRSLALDLKDSRGKELFRDLVITADVLVENLRPGTMGELGMSYADLSALNPRLIYVAISGWGQTGPYAALSGLDIMAQAMSGLMSITGEPDGPPVKAGVPVCDLVCGLYGALATMAALRNRELDGVGDFIDISLYESGVSLGIWEAGRYFATGEVPRPLGSAHQSAAPYQAIRASDGYFTVGATSGPNWTAFCRALGRPEWETDARFVSPSTRHAHRLELIEAIEATTVTQTIGHWVALLQRAGVPCAEIQTYDKVFSDPHLRERGFFWDADHPTLGAVRQLGSPLNFTRAHVRRDNAGPMLGADSAVILEELGCSPEEVASLARRGVTRLAEPP